LHGVWMRKTLLPGLIAGVLLVSSVGHSQSSFPNRPIQLVVTFPAGGSADFVARLLAERISRTLKQQVVIVNRGGPQDRRLWEVLCGSWADSSSAQPVTGDYFDSSI